MNEFNEKEITFEDIILKYLIEQIELELKNNY